ncbi:MAG: phosphoribosylformylglycinamidine synthase [Treponema sp.]|jgi:phosphoribosylformylglycinamidine synthase|nr:phosphoribosylformylglycinamidine synthase [Treponema sp.]
MPVFEIYVEKKPSYAVEAMDTAADLNLGLQLNNALSVRIINRYFAEDITARDFQAAKNTVFSEPPVDMVYDTLPDLNGARFFASEYLPGQFDQRADSCLQCISLATGKERPKIKTAKIYALYGDISDNDFLRIKSYLINPVESREASFERPSTLIDSYVTPAGVDNINGFIDLDEETLLTIRDKYSLAMDLSDLLFCRGYFRNTEKRDPTVTEIRVLDTYWSDHCRHTTFLTELESVEIADGELQKSYKNYLALREELGITKKVTLMDIATIGAKALKKRGLLRDLDESPEINACSVKIKVDVDGRERDWLLMFKNETHNHPTEIEPFGGAATCLGGAIRDPLSGRAYVYQAMRLTGAANPLQSDTLPGKLPQRKICRTAAAGYSSYGNQIGLATGHVHEIYHDGYAAKRMEIGAVIAAAPAENVIRKTPSAGDLVILLGGRTGRDGCGGATGSSKSHTASSITRCGSEVQKGNAPEERKIMRLFRNPQAARMIKCCNDFGAGGVSVSAGELADGLEIDLNKILKKYEGLDGTELAISESQERMSVVVPAKDAAGFIALASGENLEAVVIAVVTKQARLVMNWNGKQIVNLSRDFLNSNGAPKKASVIIRNAIPEKKEKKAYNADDVIRLMGDLRVCSQKGLVDRFDSVVGAATVLMPFGGKYQLTPSQVMAAKIPVLQGDTGTCSLMSWGFDPYISSVNQYHGAVNAVVHSLAKIIAAGGSRKKCWLSFQEYFESLRDDPARWGKPASALLGALDAQLGLEIAAIGGKDSMSGSFEDIDVPPTLVSFAVSVTNIDNVISTEFKKSGSYVCFLESPYTLYSECDFKRMREYFDSMEKLIARGNILSCWASSGGICEALVKMCFGNKIGFVSEEKLYEGEGFDGFIVETDYPPEEARLLGRTSMAWEFSTPEWKLPLEKLQKAWERTLEPVYPSLIKQEGKTRKFIYNRGVIVKAKTSYAKPEFVIPVFPGTNSEYDTCRAIEKAGGRARQIIIRNLSPENIADSISEFEKAVHAAQGIVIPGGFSGGDEPDGSGKFITAFFRNRAVSDAVNGLLNIRDGLICGICNGFQALIKLGLVPYGEIREMNSFSPALTFNRIGRHQSTLVRVKVTSNKSPWLSRLELGGSYLVPVSHGEGRFVAGEGLIKNLAINGQIATLYVDPDGNPTRDICYNPNNSDFAVEGITSPDGRVIGRMGHNERYDDGLFKNIPGIRKMDIFAGAAAYYG